MVEIVEIVARMQMMEPTMQGTLGGVIAVVTGRGIVSLESFKFRCY
jgi:hypothetical protein